MSKRPPFGSGRSSDSVTERHIDDTLLLMDREASRTRWAWLVTLAIAGWIVPVLGGMGDADLLRRTPVPLPVVTVDLPYQAFSQGAPWVLVLAHAILLTCLDRLASAIRRFEQDISRVGRGWNEMIDLLVPTMFGRVLVGRELPPLRRGTQAVLVVVSTLVVPFAVLIVLDLRFAPNQSLSANWLPRAAVIADLALVLAVWPRLVDRRRRWPWQRWRLPPNLFEGCGVAFVLVPAVVAYSAVHSGWNPGGLLRRHLDASHTVLVHGNRGPEVVGAVRRGTPNARRDALADITGLDLSGWDLEGADFEASLLAKVTFSGTVLDGADLRSAGLFQADFTNASLVRADLRGARLSGANFTGADLSGTRFDGACGTNITGSSEVTLPPCEGE